MSNVKSVSLGVLLPSPTPYALHKLREVNRWLARYSPLRGTVHFPGSSWISGISGQFPIASITTHNFGPPGPPKNYPP